MITKLMQCKLTLEEKLGVIKRYDDEILGLVEDGEVDDEIEQADTFNERMHRAIIDVTSTIETKRSAHIVISPPTVESPVTAATSIVVTSAPTEASVFPVTTAAISIPSTEAVDIPVTSATVTSAPPSITVSSTTTSTSMVELPVTPSVVSTPLLLSSGARTTLTSSSIFPGELPRSSTTFTGDLLPTTTIGHAPKVKLPKLTLKKFNGDLTKWTTFWDSYESSIHHNFHLSDIDKFIYLNSLLEGPVSESISGLRLTAVNYNEAVSILRRRFGQIVSKHMEALLNLEAVTSQCSLKALRHLHDLVESQVRGLRALGIVAESYGSLLSPVILSKLPPEFRLIVNSEVKEDRWQLDELMKVIDAEVRARERAINSSEKSSGSHPIRGPSRSLPTSTALLSSDSPLPKCSYCRQQHSSNSCQSVTDPSERKQILRRIGRCFVCLRKHHTSRECRSTLKCT